MILSQLHLRRAMLILGAIVFALLPLLVVRLVAPVQAVSRRRATPTSAAC